MIEKETAYSDGSTIAYNLTPAQAAAWADAIDVWGAVCLCADISTEHKRAQQAILAQFNEGGIAHLPADVFDELTSHQDARIYWNARRATLMAVEWCNPLHNAREAQPASQHTRGATRAGRTAGGMIDPHETHRASTSGLSAADEVALYVRIAHLMDQAAKHRHACERLKRAYGPTLPTPYKGVYTTHDAAREALDVQIRALGSALYPDEGAESADELEDMAYGDDAPTAGEAGRIVGHTAATADEIKRVVACADSARIVGYVESDADEPVSWRDEWRAWVVALLLIVGWCGEVALTWR